jgi:hypothetical protein
VDTTRQLLERRGMGGTILNGFVETSDLTARYDVVLFSIGVYASIPDSTTRIATLTRLAHHLSSNGRIVIICAGPADSVPSAIWLTKLSARLSKSDWIPEQGDRVARDHLGKWALKYEHLFRQGEMVRECEAAGLRVIRNDVITSPFLFQCVVAVA